MSEAMKIRLRERKSQPRKSWFRPAKTEKGKWLRFYCCLAAVAVVLFIVFFGKYFAPYDPLATDYAAKLSAPGGSHLFGTDNVGRDVLSRILYGAGNSFILTFIMIAIVSVLGTVVGIVSGFFGGLLDTVIMRLTDILLAFPDTVFAIAIVGMMGPGLLNTVIALSFVWWTKYARMARGLASVIRTKDYITEARFGGVGTAGVPICTAEYRSPSGHYGDLGCGRHDAGSGWSVVPRSGFTAADTGMGLYALRGQIIFADSTMDHAVCWIGDFYNSDCI